ncbi:hypothetical protein B0H14DRAFT_3435851 [Mycena olivaceomarginata]|nr:hypothetical protein B0H14DRAFT_3435851 [Mycena olivaceomarginata]
MPSDEHVQDEFTPNHESRIPKQEESEPEPHSIYTPVEKWFIVALIAFGVTMYIVSQGLGRPHVLGHPRRLLPPRAHVHLLPASLIGILYRSRSSRPTLLLLRCLQSAGSASTIALGAGVIGDISTLRNGAVFWGVQRWTDGRPVIGPVLGGMLTDPSRLEANRFSSSSAFPRQDAPLILILSVLFPLFIHLFNSIHPPVLVSTAFSPETLRSLVGNDNILPPAISSPVLPLIGRRAAKLTSSPLPPPANHSKTLSAFCSTRTY